MRLKRPIAGCGTLGPSLGVGGVACNRIARWDGSQWQPLGSGMNSSVQALTVFNGELIAGGGFLTAGGHVSAYFARWACESCDLNEDGDVTAEDYWLFVDSFGWCEGQSEYNPAADLDHSGCVNLLDYQAWFECYRNHHGRDFVPPPPRPELEVFIGVLLGMETSPAHVAAADRNGDQSVDGRDIRAFADELLGG